MFEKRKMKFKMKRKTTEILKKNIKNLLRSVMYLQEIVTDTEDSNEN